MARSVSQTVATQREKEAEGKLTSLNSLIRQMKPQIAMALPKGMDPDRMTRIAMTLVRQTPKLGECEPMSFIGALMTCSQLGLEPGPLGYVWIIPRENKDGQVEANFQLGYKGVIELARRSGKLAKITARTVYMREFELGRFTARFDGADEHITHEPILIGERGKPVLYYSMAKLVSGETVFTPLTPDEVETRHRQRPQAASNSPAWRNDYQSMAWKSCVVESRRWLPLSVELERAIAQDGRVRTEIDPDVLDAPVPPDMVDGEVVVDDDPPTPPPARPRPAQAAELVQGEPEDWPDTKQPPTVTP